MNKVPTQARAVPSPWLSPADARAISSTLNSIKRGLVARIGTVKRKRSWPESVRAVTIAEMQIDLENIEKLHQDVGRAHCVGGW